MMLVVMIEICTWVLYMGFKAKS